MLGIVLDAGAREMNKIRENCALVDILDVTPMAGVTCKSDGGHAGVGVVARMARKGFTTDISLTKTQKQCRKKATAVIREQQAGQCGRGAAGWGERAGAKGRGAIWTQSWGLVGHCEDLSICSECDVTLQKVLRSDNVTGGVFSSSGCFGEKVP